MIRLVLSLLIAVAITAGLFFFMQSLITSGDAELKDPVAGHVLDFVRVKKEETTKKKERKPKKPPKPEEPPPPLEQPQLTSESDASQDSGFDFSADVAADVAITGGLALESGDGEYLPIVKVAPNYPRRALSRGIEGYVIVEFTVTKNGSVKDPVVVEAEPADIFNRAAVEAAKKFKYKPRVVNGEAVEVAGVQNKIKFEMAK